MQHRLTLLLGILLFVSSICAAQKTDYSKLVNPFIGTGGHGHTYPGATLPHGMVQLSPDTRLEGWDGCGGYHYSDDFIYGFTHTHLSGTGIPDYCDILLMPTGRRPSPDNKIYGSKFSHRTERAHAGYYAVTLDDEAIATEFTTTARTGFHHYSFADTTNSVILDLNHRDELLDGFITFEDSVTISGLRRSKSWAADQYVYFVIKFSKPFVNSGVWNTPQGIGLNGKDSAKILKAFFQFDLKTNRELLVKVALSPTSVEGAKKNMQAENPDWNFERIKFDATNKWNDELGKIDVEGDEEKKKIFYTALYHTAVVPCINMDVDGSYRGMDNKIRKANGFDYYSVFSLWDTYRAAHPLYTIIDRKRTLDYIKTFLAQYKDGGRLPVWELASNETDCMIGYHSIPVIVDAYVNGIRDFDTKLAMEAMLSSANRNHFGLKAYRTKGVIEADDEQEGVSRTLEYAFDDWCIAKFASMTGEQNVADTFSKRAQYWKNVFDKSTGFMRPRKNGNWLTPFEPREVNNHYTEANSWQYSFYVPQDVEGLAAKLGGRDSLEKKLDALFTAPRATTGRDQSDITGLIGQYAHGNEPSHHTAYLYNYTPHPEKTLKYSNLIMEEFYKNSPDGLIGNEDCGQMSAWYVMSAMGLYPLTPASGYYEKGQGQFKSVLLKVDGGKKEGIDMNAAIATGASRRISHESLLKLAGLSLPEVTTVPEFLLNGKKIDRSVVANPTISGGPMSFNKSTTISISSIDKDAEYFYTFGDFDSGYMKKRYDKPFRIDSSITIKAIAVGKNGGESYVTTAEFKKMAHDWTVKLSTPYEPMYDGGGASGLIDGVRGDVNWRKGNWQGYQKENLDMLIDLKKGRKISEVTAGFLQDIRAWIVMPKKVTVEISNDGKIFRTVSTAENLLPITDLEPQLKYATARFSPVSARYIRVRAAQYGKLPDWHEGKGGDTHIFIDEIEIK